MREHQARMIAEKTELDDRLDKLKEFINGPTYDTLHPAEQQRLRSQRYYMDGYSQVLEQRIDAFSD
jgi:hypothetical protein